jgi:nitrous oxidase accessory protein
MTIRSFPVLLLLLLLSAALPARTIVVEAGKTPGGLKGALAGAADFDTIIVKAGTYREGPLVISKPLTIIGQDWPVIDGEKKCQPISVSSNRVSITGLFIRNGGYSSLEDWAAIKVYKSRHVHIFNNRFDDNNFAIYLSGSRECTVSDNQIVSYGTVEQMSGNGIHAWKCDSLTILDNRIKGHRDGIYFEFVGHSLIARNHSEGNIRYGLHFMFSHDDEYMENTFVNNGAGVAVMYSKRVDMHGNIFGYNRGAAAYGLLLKDISDSEISDNQFLANTSGIFMEGCSRSQFERNKFHQNGWAIKLQASCENNNFRYNNFTANTFDIATNNALVLNSLSNNYWDHYEGYDLDKDGIGDVPYRPVSLYSMLADQMPYAMMLWRSFCVYLLDRAEKVIPSLSPDNLRDNSPLMHPYDPGTPS